MTHLTQAKPCSVDGCEAIYYAKGLCKRHYRNDYKRTHPRKSYYTPRFRKGRVSCKRSAAENIEACTERDAETGCLNWIGSINDWGYGQYGSRLAHRVSYEDSNGPIPDGLWVLHRCDNPRCVEPTHLFLGTNTENTADRVFKGRCAFAKLKADQVRAIRADQRTRSAIARDYGLSPTTVRRICNRKSWRFVA